MTFLAIAACSPKGSVEINTAGIFNPVLFSINNQDADGKTIDLGEHILTDDPKSIRVRVYNQTQYPYTDIDLKMAAEGDNAPAISFIPNAMGEVVFPGLGGNCARTLAPGAYCDIYVTFAPREGRVYNEILTLDFRNYVDKETHTGKVTLIAGMPASLTFSNDTTQYTFGSLVGPTLSPVVERADSTIYTEELELVNAGGLPASSTQVTLQETCTSTATNLCPPGMAGAFSIVNHCPAKIMPGEKCKINVNFKPKNQDPASGPVPEEIKEINYRATINTSYVKDPAGTTAAINGYFRSISSNIEARFRVAISTVKFETPIIAGNRELRSFRANNLGYREGEIKALAVRDIGGSLIGTCRKGSGSTLDCFDASDTILTLAQFPFTINDKNDCIVSSKLIDVGNGCIFDIIFQPSVTFLNDMPTQFQDLQVEIVYDSKWQGNEKIIASKLFNLSASSVAAARLVPDKFRFDGIEYPISGESPGIIDMGRLALQSQNFFKRKAMIITFKNVGSVAATDLNIRDSLNRVIPIGGTSTTLGSYNPRFYSTVVASESTCSIVNPQDSCSITLLFAPIGMNTSDEENANMFDGVGANGRQFKGFNIGFTSGAKYTDTNRNGTPDYVAPRGQLQINAELIRKGMLMQLADDPRNVNNFGTNVGVTGTTSISHIYFQNIGTGDIPYIRLENVPTLATNPSVEILPTSDPVSLGAHADCLNILDVDTTGTVPLNANPNTRVGNFATLEKEKSCVFTVKMRTPDSYKRVNHQSCTNNTTDPLPPIEEGTRLISRDFTGIDIWEFCGVSGGNINYNITAHFYDGDDTDPNLPPGSTFGAKSNITPYNYAGVQFRPAKLIPTSFFPYLTATLYRPQIDYPNTGVPGQPARTVLEKWFYGIATDFFHVVNDPLQTSLFMQGDKSRDFVPTLPSFANKDNYDYILYLGSFPQGSPAFSFPIIINNMTNFNGRVTALNIAPTPGFTVVNQPTIPLNITPNGQLAPLNFSFNPSAPGEHTMELNYSYHNGAYEDPLIYHSSVVATNLATATKTIINQKILVVAHVQATGTYPYLTMKVRDYEVTQNEGSAPTEVLQPEYTASLSWNTAATTTNLVFDTVKLSAAPTSFDSYAKKLLTFTNPSPYPLTDLRLLYKADLAGIASKLVPNSFKNLAGSTCTSGMTLNPGASCTQIVFYQPQASDTSESFLLTAIYRMGAGQYVMQNSGITLLPRAPGNISVLGSTAESINYKATAGSSTITRFSYPLNISTITLNTVPRVLTFNQPSGAYKILNLVNSESTKASLLLSYHKYLSQNSLRGYSPGSPAPSSVIPAPAEYRTVDGHQYAIIHKIKYDDGADRVVVEASKGCLFGDDENDAGIPAHMKGFNNTTIEPCNAIVTFNVNFEYLRKSILANNGDDMRGTASELWYYSVNRSSTASLWIHIKGVVNPDVSIASGSYGNIVTSDTRTASFSVPKMTANNSSLGNVVGLRVLVSSSSTGLNDPYNTALQYFDIRPYDSMSNQFANFTSGLSNGQYYWFRTVAIRKDNRFVDSTPKRFVGLGAGEYLSATSSTSTLKTLIPPLGHYYLHAKNILVEKSLNAGQVTYDPHGAASAKCSARTVSIKNPGTVSYNYQLIHSSIWADLLATPAANSYTNMNQISHWVSDAQVSIDAQCSGLPGFLPNSSSQTLSSSRVFYIRNSGNPGASVNISLGGVPGTSYSDYVSYIDGAIGFASARCMVALPP